jgi:hypothetical protein
MPSPRPRAICAPLARRATTGARSSPTTTPAGTSRTCAATAASYRGTASGGQLAIGAANAAAVLRNPRIALTGSQRADLRRGGIDPRVIATLEAAGRERSLVITAMQSATRRAGRRRGRLAGRAGARTGDAERGRRRGDGAAARRTRS